MPKEVILRFVGDAGQLNRTFQQVESNAAGTMGRLSAATASASATMSSKFSSAGASLAAAGAGMRRSGARMTRNIALPLAAIGGLGLKTAIDYERNMNVLQSVSGATGDQMAGFGRLAQTLGADLTLPGTSAADAAAAMVELAKAGLSVNDAMGAARGVLQLSAAGGLSNADAATVAANALNAFHLKGTDALRVADLLAAAANASSAEVTDLALAVADGASVFAQAGIPIEDFVSSAAMLANVGISGARSGTMLKQMVLSLQKPSKEAAAVMDRLGINVYDLQGRMKPLRTIIADFTAKTAGLTQEQRAASLATIFGSDAVQAANGVLLAGAPAFDAMKTATTEQGAAAKLAGARNKGLGGALDALKSSMETLALKVLVPALPVLTRFVTALANFIPKISKLPKPVLIAAAAIGALLVAIGPLTYIFGAIASAVGLLFGGPFLLIAGAVAAIGIAIAAALNPEKAGAMMDAFKAKWAELAPGVLAHLATFGAAVWGWLQVNVPIIVAQLAKWAQAFIEWILPLIPPALQKLGTFLGAIGTWILDVGAPALAQQLRDNWIPAFVGWVSEIGPPLLLALGKMLVELQHWITFEAVPKILAALAKMAISIPVGLAKAAANAAVDTVTASQNKGGGGLGGGVKKAVDVVTGPIGGFLGLASGGLLLGVNRPTPLLVGEGHGREDVLAVPHSKGGLAGALGGGMSQTNHFYGVSLEEAATRSERSLAWRLALAGRR